MRISLLLVLSRGSIDVNVRSHLQHPILITFTRVFCTIFRNRVPFLAQFRFVTNFLLWENIVTICWTNHRFYLSGLCLLLLWPFERTVRDSSRSSRFMLVNPVAHLGSASSSCFARSAVDSHFWTRSRVLLPQFSLWDVLTANRRLNGSLFPSIAWNWLTKE